MNNDLRSKTVKAMGQMGLGGALGKVISLASTLVMARLLSPADYGLMAMAMTLVGFVGFFNEVGIGAAIVQKAELDKAEVNGCFAFSILASVVLFCATVLLSGPVAGFFGTPHLQPMIAVLATAFIFGAVGTVPTAFLRKEMNFKAVAGISVLQMFVQAGLSLALAWLGFGAWALVWSFVAASIAQSIGAFWLSSWRPRGAFGMRAAYGIVAYGLHVTTTRIFWYLYSNADKVIIGKVLGDRALGIYDMALSLATLPTSQITTLATNVASPLFSRLQADLPQLRAFILHITRGVAYVTYPALIGMLVCSRELVAVLLGEKWIGMLVPFGALCVMGLIRSVDPLLSQVLIATGHARKLSGYTLMCGVAMTIAVVGGALADGLRGVSLVWMVVYPLLSIRLLQLVGQVTGLKMAAYYATLLPVLTASAAMAAIVLAMRELLLVATLPPIAMLVTEVATGALAYILWIVHFDKRGLAEIRQVLIDLGISERKLARWPFNRAVPL
jgi:O-antigen/teichoic acid export membrane protein